MVCKFEINGKTANSALQMNTQQRRPDTTVSFQVIYSILLCIRLSGDKRMTLTEACAHSKLPCILYRVA